MKKFLVLGCSFFWLSVATAEIPKYRYLDLAYVDSNLEVELDDAKEDVDQEGYEIEASYGFFDNRLLLVGSYTEVSGDLGPVDVDLDRDLAREDVSLAVYHGDGGLVTTGLDGEGDHGVD